MIRSEWSLGDDGAASYEFELPPTAEVRLPRGSIANAAVNNVPAAQAAGVLSAHETESGLVLELGSGTYRVVVQPH
ncbi:hypothetical protein ACP26L_10285 [Paenibacillus sp. S-38]|uniref:hypothetical protein n=1 Tax=Paenibacillus sp. S-38 TaxID=3416710 RepID=UPI003CE8B2C2